MTDSRLKHSSESRQINRIAFLEMFDICKSRLLSTINANMDRRLRSRVDANDVLQNTFLELFRKLPDYRARKTDVPMAAWIFLEAKQQLAQTHRRHLGTQKRDSRLEQTLESVSDEGQTWSSIELSSVVSNVIRREMNNILSRELEKLPPKDFEVVWYRCFEGLSTQQTADKLGVSKSTIGKRYVKAVLKLKQKLQSLQTA